MILLGAVVVLGLVFVTGAMVLQAVVGPDQDLEGPYDPREPLFRRRSPCRVSGCQVTHGTRGGLIARSPR